MEAHAAGRMVLRISFLAEAILSLIGTFEVLANDGRLILKEQVQPWATGVQTCIVVAFRFAHA